MEVKQHRKAPWVAETCWGYVPLVDIAGEGDGVVLDDRCPWRCYEMFGYMAGVRFFTHKGYVPRGYPSDMSPEVGFIANLLVDKTGFHTPSWLTLREYKRCLKLSGLITQLSQSDDILEQIEKQINKMQFDNSLLGIKDKPKARLIFCFDS